MATESSAVVRFISLARQERNPVRTTEVVTNDFGTEVLREVRPNRTPWLVGAALFAAAAAGGGIFIGKSYFASSSSSGKTAAPSVAPGLTPAPTPAPAAAPAPAPTPDVQPVVTTPTDVMAETGFDIRIEPGGIISLDGAELGKAPLRVRNLQPGTHVIDIEAPAGYFSRRVELPLDAGEAKELKMSLDPIEEAVTGLPAEDEKASDDKKSRPEKVTRRSRKEEKKAREEKKKKERLAARAKKAEKSSARRESAVTAEPLPEEAAADAELDAAMAEIVGKPGRKSAAKSEPAPARAASLSPGAKGTLMLGSKPPCDILIDGKPTGLKTPQRAIDLAAGSYRVTLVNKDLGIEKKFKVKIAPGKTTKAIQDLTSAL